MHMVPQGKGSRDEEGRVRAEQTRKWTHHQPERRVKHCLGCSQQWHEVTGLENDDSGCFPNRISEAVSSLKNLSSYFLSSILIKVFKVLNLLIGAFQTPACSL